ncbi:hypothetical protein Peur_025260 [Populus x canadensis]|uniref:thioredoxin F-type, chloroplastic-like n=1 Tax=Populus nigra TaxID=3691 RepID=UPI002B270EAE|nr:thioredoxin F-type, chloroplastic-like [Populus nigra]
MASIQFTLSPTSSIRSSPSFAGSPANPITPQYSSTPTKDLSSYCKLSSRQKNVIKRNGSRNLVSTVRSSLDTAGPTSAVGQVTEVTKDTFWPIVNSSGDKTVVLDMYTQWCGPCKLIAPKYKELSQKYDDVVFLKLDCNQENKPLAKELGIKVVPTFKILKQGKIVKEVTGAKFDNLVIAIESVRSAS